jgi:hypothetical protein
MTHPVRYAGKHKNTTFTQENGRKLTSFHFEMTEDHLVEMTICTYDADTNRHEFVTTLDQQMIAMLKKFSNEYFDWYENLDKAIDKRDDEDMA